MNIVWAMDGMDLNLNTQISKHLADLGHTLTTLTSEEAGNQGSDHDDESSLSSTDSEGLNREESVSCVFYVDLCSSSGKSGFS